MENTQQELGGAQAGPARMVPTGSVDLTDERLRSLAAAWEGTFKSLRRMDEIPLGETEPTTLFTWGLVKP